MKGLEISKTANLQNWKAIFECWHAEIDKITIATSGIDAPYVHSEAGNVICLSSAASIAGNATICEAIGYRKTEKGRSGGRNDLCIISESYLDLVEAKYCEFNPRTQWILNVKQHIKIACRDAGNYQNDSLFSIRDKKRRIGLTFLSIHFNEHEVHTIIDSIGNILAEIRSEISPDILAWSFPEITRNMKYFGRIHPGVIAIVTSDQHPSYITANQ